MASIVEIISLANKLPGVSQRKIINAYEYAEQHYVLMNRLDGEPYINHSLRVTKSILEYHPDESTIIASLLHGLPARPGYDYAHIERLFGSDVGSLIKAMEFLRRVKSVDLKSDLSGFQKMFLAIAGDVRVVLIKLADRLDDMYGLEFREPVDRKAFARETLDIFVPVAARMGLYKLKNGLEDACFRYLYPKQYEIINAQLDEYISNHGRTIDEIKCELQIYLDENGVKAKVDGRIKNLFSIYKKLKYKTHTTIDDIYDVFAVRIILPTRVDKNNNEIVDHLYAILGMIHHRWKPVANRFKDYVSVPRPTGYRSLHTAVIGLFPDMKQATEIQIRSQKMHDEAEFGTASHWIYEDMKKILTTYNYDRDSLGLSKNVVDELKSYDKWLSHLSSLPLELRGGSGVMEAIKLEVLNDRVFVFTPSGDVKDLPLGSSPVDFAYAIHTDVGHKCLTAKVNGSIVPLDYQLKNGDQVEIITSNKPQPKLNWLQFVKTALARTKIKSFLKSLDKGRNLCDGKEMLNNLLLKCKKDLLDEDLSIFKIYEGKRLSYRDRVILVEEVGAGIRDASSVLRSVMNCYDNDEKKVENEVKKFSPRSAVQKENTIYIAGQKDVPHKLASCCKPQFGSPIVGYVTRGGLVAVHLEGCKLLRAANQQRILEASWSIRGQDRRFHTRIVLHGVDRVGLIRDVADVVSGFNANIIALGKQTLQDKEVSLDLTLEASSADLSHKIISSLNRIRNIRQVEKIE